MMGVGAFYCCFNQPLASYHAVKWYREAYPDSTFIMINDAGDHIHEKIAKEFNVSHYRYDTNNIGFPGEKPTIDNIIAWIKRMVDSLEVMKEDWFILLEDDVRVVRPINEQQLIYDINGLNVDAVLPKAATDYLLAVTDNSANVTKNIRGNRVSYGGMGGAIFRTQFFRQLGARWDQVIKDLRHYEKLCPPDGQNWYYSDTCLSYLTYLYGGSVGNVSDFTELWWPNAMQQMLTKKVAIVNQYKTYYNQNFDASILNIQK